MKIVSPISTSLNVEIYDTVSREDIINAYRDNLEIEVGEYLNQIESIKILRCLDTNYLFYYPFNVCGDEYFYDRLKIQLPAKYNAPYYSAWKWEYGVCLDFIKPSDKVYEIGCGFGDFILKLKENGTAAVSGTELNHDSVNAAIYKGLEVEYITVQNKAKLCKDAFDVVCTFQVLEHIAEVKSFLDASIHILKPGGRLMIAVPFNDPYLFKHDKMNTLNLPPHHMGLWGEAAFKNLIKFFPIELEELIIEKLPNSGYDFEQYYTINKDVNFSPKMPFKKLYDKLYYKWLKRNHLKKNGKNIIAIYKKLK